MKYDVVVVGAGRTARTAALEAAECGLRVALLTGTEAQIRRAEAVHRGRRVRSAVEEVLRAKQEGPVPSMRDRVASALAGKGERDVMLRQCREHDRIEVSSGGVRLAPRRVVSGANGERWEAGIIVLAPDTHARRPSRFAFDDASVYDPDLFWLRGELPRSAVIIGADSQGCALACTLGAAGVPVTVIDRRARSVRFLDRDILAFFHSALRDAAVELVLSENLADVVVERQGVESRVCIRLESGRLEICDALVVAGGHEPATRDLELAPRVDTDARGFILTDERGETSCPGIFAAGLAVSDLSPGAESHLGRTVVRSALGLTNPEWGAMPIVIGTIPEIAAAGLNAEMCAKLDVPVIEATAELETPDPSRRGDLGGAGRLKLVADRRTTALVGVQVVGLGAFELLQPGLLLVEAQRSIRDLLALPTREGSTWSSYARAARDALLAVRRPPLDRDPALPHRIAYQLRDAVHAKPPADREPV